MQAYGAGFARVYNIRWGGFAKQIAPLLMQFYEATPIAAGNKNVLDLCCGTGQLAACFLERGYNVTGIDLSEPMLVHARQNAAPHTASGQAKFIQGDVTDFALDERFGLVVSTYDSLNHLDDEPALEKCFRLVYELCDGHFIFDLNTRSGLRHRSGVQVDDSDAMLMIAHRLFDAESDTGWSQITGFLRNDNGLYERFDETAFNRAHDMTRVREILRDVGWSEVHFTPVYDLGAIAPDPEQEGRVFVVARK